LTTHESDEKDKTARIELPRVSRPAATDEALQQAATTDAASGTEPGLRPTMTARAVSPAQQDVMFVPLAVSIGDGFKFGCGFFLAMVLAMLVGFVLLALLFVLTSLFGLNLPISR
jgi:hypothetical protein